MNAQKQDLGSFLDKLCLKGKDIAVVGPNMEVWEDPSLMYFANRMHKHKSTLTVIDRKPHWEEASHGNIDYYMGDLKEYQERGVDMKLPEIILGDVTKLTTKKRFDILYDHCTLKCIYHSKIKNSVERILSSYESLLKPHGKLILVYPDVQEGLFNYVIANKDYFGWKLEPHFFIDRFAFRNKAGKAVKIKYAQSYGKMHVLLGDKIN